MSENSNNHSKEKIENNNADLSNIDKNSGKKPKNRYEKYIKDVSSTYSLRI